MRFLSLANRNMKEIYRDPVSISLGLAMPVGLLMLFILIGKNAPVEIFKAKSLTPGVIVFSFAFLMMFSATLLSKDRQSAFLARLLASPLKSTDFILAYSLPFLPIAILQIVVCFIVGIIFGVPLNLGLLYSLVVFIPIALVFICLGMVLGSLLTENQIAGAGSIIIVATSLLGGAWMDLKMVGGTFESIAYALPFAHAIDAARSIFNQSSLGNIGTDLYWIVGYALAFLALGIISFRWKTHN